MPRRDGSPTVEEIAAAQRAAQQPDLSPTPGAGPPPQAVAAAALTATVAAAGSAAAAASPIVASAAAAQAIAHAAAGILAAFARFLARRRAPQQVYLLHVLEEERPTLSVEERLQIVAAEMERERLFAAKARERMSRDLRAALALPDADERADAVRQVLDRERRIVRQREQAMAERVIGRAQSSVIRSASPQGAYWRLSGRTEPCPKCVAMAGKVWPWSVLDIYQPPIHPHCGCTLWTINEARRMGWIGPDDFASRDDLPGGDIMESIADVLGLGVDDLDDAMALLESRYDERFAKGTTKAGEFRPRRGGIAGPRVHRPHKRGHGFGMPSPAVEPVAAVDHEADVHALAVADLKPGDRVLVNGELQRVEHVRSPGLIELDGMGLVHIDRDTIRGVSAEPERSTLADEFPVGAQLQQYNGKTKIRMVRVVGHEGDQIKVRALNGPLAGEEYTLPAKDLRAPGAPLPEPPAPTPRAARDLKVGDVFTRKSTAQGMGAGLDVTYEVLGEPLDADAVRPHNKGKVEVYVRTLPLSSYHTGGQELALDPAEQLEVLDGRPSSPGLAVVSAGTRERFEQAQRAEAVAWDRESTLSQVLHVGSSARYDTSRSLARVGLTREDLTEDRKDELNRERRGANEARKAAQRDVYRELLQAGAAYEIRDHSARLKTKPFEIGVRDETLGVIGGEAFVRDTGANIRLSRFKTREAAQKALDTLNARELERLGQLVPEPGGALTHEQVTGLLSGRAPAAGGELVPGFVFDPELSRSEARDGVLHLPPGFFKLAKAKRESVVFRHLGGGLADDLGPEGIAALAKQDPHLSSRKAVVDTYYALNTSARDRMVELHPDASRLVAAAAQEHGLPLHPEAVALIDKPAVVDTPEPEHPSHALAARLVGLTDGETHSALMEAGYMYAADGDAPDTYVYRNHDAGAQVTIAYKLDGRHSRVETATAAVNPELAMEQQVAMAQAVGDRGLDAYMNDQGFGASTMVGGEWLEFVHPDGRGVAWHVDGPQAGRPRTFTPSTKAIADARGVVFRRDPLSAISVGDDVQELRNMLDYPASSWQMEKSGGRGETVDGQVVDLPEGTIGFATFGRGDDAITIQYADDNGTWRVAAAGLADPDGRPGRIVSPEEHAAVLRRRDEERQRREAAERARAETQGSVVADAVRTGDAKALREALRGQSATDAARLLGRHGLEARSRRRTRNKTTREMSITYTLRGPGGETVKITGPLTFGASEIAKVEVQANPQGGKRTRLPAGRAPKTLDELLVDTLGRADELGERFDAGVHVTAVVQGGVSRGAAAHHEWNGTIAIGKTTQGKRLRDYFAKRKAGAELSDREHLRFYDDLETLQHEVNHGVAKRGDKEGGLSFGPGDYRGLGKNVEEALTEETAHLLTVDWLRSYGMTDVLEAVKRNPDDASVKGVYREYRVELKALLDDAGVPAEERADLLLRMKFEMSPAERNAELVRLARAENLNRALRGIGSREEAARRRDMRRFFEPVVRPDLSDVDAEIPSIAQTRAGRDLRMGDEVTVDDGDGRQVLGRIVGWQERFVDGKKTVEVEVLGEDGIRLMHASGRVN